MTETLTLVFSILSLILCVVTLIVVISRTKKKDDDSLTKAASELRTELTRSVQESVKLMADMSAASQKDGFEAQNNSLKQMNESIVNMLKQFENRLKTLETTNEQKLTDMRSTISTQLTEMRAGNDKRLDEIRTTVDEKLQKTLEDKMNQSFKLVSERLEEVYKGLGEMQTLASGVGDLKKVLSNVKTRGILGEIQLGAILEEILAPEQYDKNAVTIPGRNEPVEFAVKLPGEDGSFVYLPIDSKFPGDTYAQLQDAYESGSAEAVNAAVKALTTRIKQEAKDIRTKYVEPPYTTNFAIMFLPFEGLYAEVVNRGLVEVLQREYNVNIAGPSTMAALLNSLQMGFKTLAIQKRSNEVWTILGAVKSEFDKFEEALTLAQKRIQAVDADLDKLVGTRSRAISRKLRQVEQLDSAEAVRVLEIEE